MQRHIALTVAWGLCSGSAGVFCQTRISYSTDIGLASSRSVSTCLYIHNPKLPMNSRLTLISPGIAQSVTSATVIRHADDSCPADQPDLDRYEIRLDNDRRPDGPVIAIRTASVSVRQAGDLVTVDLQRDGHRQYFRMCASTEGLHLTLWSGQPLKSTRLWHQYYYLGYDVTPDCTSRDYQ